MSEWEALRRVTAARIGLARAGASLGTRPLLEFRLAQARARDAVAAELDEASLGAALKLPFRVVRSQAGDRREYLMRPDLGRALHAADGLERGVYDLVIVVADGLSAAAAERHAPALLRMLLPGLDEWALAPVTIARNARVMLGDRIAEGLGARAVLVLIGERPGLSAPDSLGGYLTWAPGPGTTDADRNCVSNIRPDGLPYEEAAGILTFLLRRMRALGRSGVALKDESQAGVLSLN